MRHRCLLVALLIVSARPAAADPDPSLPSSAIQPQATPATPVVQPPAPVDARAGFHLGGSVGGVYVPVSEGISALIFRFDLHWGRPNGELRVSPLAFLARNGDDPSFGIGGLVERRWHATASLSVGAGVMTAGVIDDGDLSFAIGPCLTPVAYTFGARRNLEVGLEVFLLRNVGTSSNLPGGYVSLTYLAL
jgi:hypothetical protein